MKDMLLIKYAELSTKKGNRKQFIKKLADNINNSLNNLKYELIIDYNHLILKYNESDYDQIIDVLTHTFGISKIIPVVPLNKDIEVLKAASLELISTLDIKTFKVNTKRSDKEYPQNSQEHSS